MMMNREELFAHLMEHDEEFRMAVANSAVEVGMDLYQAGLSLLGDKSVRTEAVASAATKVINKKNPSAKNPSAKKKDRSSASAAKIKAAKARGKRMKAESPEQREKRLQANEKVRDGIVRTLQEHGPLSISEVKAKLHHKTKALVVDDKHFQNQISKLKLEKRIRWTRGSKKPNIRWEAV